MFSNLINNSASNCVRIFIEFICRTRLGRSSPVGVYEFHKNSFIFVTKMTSNLSSKLLKIRIPIMETTMSCHLVCQIIQFETSKRMKFESICSKQFKM